MYVSTKQAGLDGWGGNKRLTKCELVSRFCKLVDIPIEGKLLELGCGEGHHCRALVEAGYNVTGIDISSTAISWAEEKAITTGIDSSFLTADLTDPLLKLPQKYHVIIDGNCLHCIIGDDRSVVLNHVFNSLEDHGAFFVSSLCSKDSNNHSIYKDNCHYRHISSAPNLVTELEHCGFKIVKTEIYERQTHDHITVHATKRK